MVSSIALVSVLLAQLLSVDATLPYHFCLSSLSIGYFTKSQNIKGEGVIAKQFIPYIGLNIDYFRSNTIKIICIHIHQ